MQKMQNSKVKIQKLLRGVQVKLRRTYKAIAKAALPHF